MGMTAVNEILAGSAADELAALLQRDGSAAALTVDAEAIEGIEKVLIGLGRGDLMFAQTRAPQLIRGIRRALAATPGVAALGAAHFIGLGGRLRSGKDAFADHLAAEHGYVKLGMSDALLEHMLIIDPWIRVTIREGIRLRIWPRFRRASWLVGELGYVEAKTIADFRTYMQKDGTDGGRNFFGEDIWVGVMRDRIAARLADGERIVFTGVRYPNELAMVRSLGGQGLWISRPAVEASAGAHSSENSLDANDFDETVDNSGTLEQLHAAADLTAVTP